MSFEALRAEESEQPARIARQETKIPTDKDRAVEDVQPAVYRMCARSPHVPPENFTPLLRDARLTEVARIQAMHELQRTYGNRYARTVLSPKTDVSG